MTVGEDGAEARKAPRATGRFFRYTAAFWSLCILALCLWPHPRLPETPPGAHFDKVVHSGIFVVQAFLLRGAGLKTTPTLALGAVLALGTEFLQAGLPSLGRSGDLLDAFSDIAGLVAGLLLFQLWSGRRPASSVS